MVDKPWKGAGPSFLRDAADQDLRNHICSACADIKLKLALLQPQSEQDPDVESLAAGLATKTLDKDVPPATPVRIDIFDLAEAAELGSCLFCALVFHSITTLGARLPSIDENFPVAVV